MSPYVERIVASIREAEEALADDVQEQQRRWRYTVRQGRVWFDTEVRRAQKQLKQGIPSFLRHGSLRNLFTTPIIYSLVVPLLLLDIWVSLYQWICFPIYGIPCVSRARYFAIDRHKLAYLNTIEKANCTYCSYTNGLFAYVREVGGRTEQYWCPIRHSRPIPNPHAHYQMFFDYGDARGYRDGLSAVRKALARQQSRPVLAKTNEAMNGGGYAFRAK